MVKQISVSRGRRLFIVVIHLHPLPGSPRWGEDMERVSRFALDDARACEEGGADAIIIENFGDVHVKHASRLGNLPIEIAARDTAERGLADALVLSGTTTGQPANLDDVRCVRSACREIPILIGSGVTMANGAAYLEFADGIIVGTSVKRDGNVSNPVDGKRVAALRKAIHQGEP
jgi:predicted TIM-barrel enzyme